MDLSKAEPIRFVVILILMVALYIGWGFMSGRRGRVSTYTVALVVAVSLVFGAAAKGLGLAGLAESLSVTWFSLALAALASPPRLWEVEIRDSWEHSLLFQSLRFADVLSWRGWLKLVDRVGLRNATTAYFGVFMVGMGCQAAAWGIADIFFVLALLVPFIFAGFSAVWIRRGARLVMPGA